jgi:hypothetical protein
MSPILGIAVAHCGELSLESQSLIKAMYRDTILVDICVNETTFGMNRAEAVWRLRGFFCKIAALILSPFDHTMLIDLDVVWFQKPDLLFESEAYKNTGALFFRDRVYIKYQLTRPNVNSAHLIKFFLSHGMQVYNSTLRKKLYLDNGINFFWKFGGFENEYYDNNVSLPVPQLTDYQDSSVVLVNRLNHPKFLNLLGENIASFGIGLADKEMCWILTTLSGLRLQFLANLNALIESLFRRLPELIAVFI